jgi:COP9 signalosome complex subunit 4
MASPQVLEALQSIAASAEKQEGFERLLAQVRSTPAAQLPGDFIAIIDAMFGGSLGIVASRSLSTLFVETLKAAQNNDTKTEVGEHALTVFQSQPSSFEEQAVHIRELMADAFESDEDFLSAAKVLAGTPLESSQRKVANEDKVRFWIRITRNYLEVDDTTLAEQYLNKVKNIIYTVSDRDLNLHFRLWHASKTPGEISWLLRKATTISVFCR